jgi:integrase
MLTRLKIESVNPSLKRRRLFDGRGLYLEIAPSGGRWWRFKYRFERKEKRISLGVYPEVGIKEARERCAEVRKQLAAGIDPGAKRKAESAVLLENTENTFQAIAAEWIRLNISKWSSGNGYKISRLFERDIFPWIGSRPIKGISALELLTVCRRIEGRNAHETTHRALQNCGRVFRYAVATGRADRDPSRDLIGALAPVISRHHASITDPVAVGKLLNDIDSYSGSFVTCSALRLAPLVFVRPGELRKAEWSEIDLDKAEWRIPAAKMKMKALHVVPLSKQAVAVLRELQPLTAKPNHSFVFPSERTWMRPMSNNTVNAALRSLGYSHSEMTGHGFRSTASTMLNERGWNRDAIERQLAHAERDSVRAAYNYAEHLPERRKMMQAWSDYLDDLRVAARRIISLSKRAA